MTQSVDRSRLVRLWSVKSHWVPRTNEEIAYITWENGAYSAKKIIELRRKFNEENDMAILNPWDLKDEDEQTTTSDTQTSKEEEVDTVESGATEEIEEVTIEGLQKEYEELYKVEPANRYKSDVDWLIKKIEEKKGE